MPAQVVFTLHKLQLSCGFVIMYLNIWNVLRDNDPSGFMFIT